DLDLPVVLGVTNRRVSVARNLAVLLRKGSGNVVRVEVAAGLDMEQANNGTVANEPGLRLGVEVGIGAVGVEIPLVVGVLVVVAGDLLLSGAVGVGLDVRVEQSTAISHVLDGDLGTERDLERAVLSDIGTLEVSLEQGAHLGVARA